MLSMQALHVKVAETAVPKYSAALGSESNTSTGPRRGICRGVLGAAFAEGVGGRGRCRMDFSTAIHVGTTINPVSELKGK
jgi:hypothetical protein